MHMLTHMLDTIRKLLDFRVSIGQLIAMGLILGTPYLLVGTIWSMTHTEHLHQMHGIDLAVSFLGSIVSWPVLLFSNVCMT
jgi:NADH:ubiquinone oxidoreductase subunit 4 (subunit M)